VSVEVEPSFEPNKPEGVSTGVAGVTVTVGVEVWLTALGEVLIVASGELVVASGEFILASVEVEDVLGAESIDGIIFSILEEETLEVEVEGVFNLS